MEHETTPAQLDKDIVSHARLGAELAAKGEELTEAQAQALQQISRAPYMAGIAIEFVQTHGKSGKLPYNDSLHETIRCLRVYGELTDNQPTTPEQLLDFAEEIRAAPTTTHKKRVSKKIVTFLQLYEQHYSHEIDDTVQSTQ